MKCTKCNGNKSIAPLGFIQTVCDKCGGSGCIIEDKQKKDTLKKVRTEDQNQLSLLPPLEEEKLKKRRGMPKGGWPKKEVVNESKSSAE